MTTRLENSQRSMKVKKPALHRRFVLFVVDSWRVVMDNRFNPLRHIPDPSLQMYFTLVLFVMWSFYFGLIAAYWGGLFGYYNTITSLIVHIAIVVPVGFTNAIFLDAERENAPWLYQWRQENEQWRFWLKRPSLKGKNIVKWDIDKEA